MNTQTFSHFANLIKSFIRFYNDLYSASAHNILEHVFQKGPSKACVDYKTLNLSEDLKEYIVSIHNDIRNHVASGQETKGGLGRQPSAANMNMLEWDDELAAVAQRWADQCIPINETIQHDICKRSKRFEVGQNVITAVTADQDFPELAALILHWYKQVGNVIPSDIDHFSGIKRGQFMIGQYTQLVWAKTRYIGCGISIFLDIQSSTPKKKFYNHRLVCNYGPAGNILGHTVYQKGIPCSKCAWGQCDIFRTSLCTSKDYGGRTIPKPKKDILIDEEELDYKNIKYRKVRGIWLDGQCKCDLLYRSNKNKIGVKQYVLLLVIGIIIIS
ncbi:unnamed protein product [Acanthoscelides obtectus]|uniref:SCP domain-containing protein n=1 Tax=Acanthoscelides obtectus TaxID=200917 RepID=A0A9P0P533_ACAOB|nr:unnamed protein product [Acanthoscelides obtectus]CAK1629733.1 hypothetical protein AOBTE_LOCUS5918 [Acanthoscelides obtectus]